MMAGGGGSAAAGGPAPHIPVLGAPALQFLNVRDGGIYVGEDLAPSRFLELDWQRCRGVALAGANTG